MPPNTARQLRDNDGQLLKNQRWDETSGQFVPGASVSVDSLGAGENLDFDFTGVEAGATQFGGNVLPGRIDQVIGTVGNLTDYLRLMQPVVSATTDSRVVLKEGNPLPKKGITTHGATPATTTQITTANNLDAVVANQYQHHMIRVGTGPYRKILAHAAFAAGAVNVYQLDQALDVAPGVNVPVFIEDPDLVFEVLPLGAPVGSHEIKIQRFCRGDGWRVSTGTTVHCPTTGHFDNV